MGCTPKWVASIEEGADPFAAPLEAYNISDKEADAFRNHWLDAIKLVWLDAIKGSKEEGLKTEIPC